MVSLTDWPEEELPGDFKSAVLQSLAIHGGKLKTLPADFAKRFPKLETLRIERVALNACPADLHQLTKLKWLFRTGLRLTGLPDVLGRIRKLGIVSLRENPVAADKLREAAAMFPQLDLGGN